MSKQHKRKLTPQSWFKLLFRQPPAGMYRRPSVYMTGTQMEIEHFRRIRTYDQNKLCLELYGGTFTVMVIKCRFYPWPPTGLPCRGGLCEPTSPTAPTDKGGS